MAALAPKGTYVKLLMHVWYDRRNDNIHLTAGPDPDLPPGGIHMTAKRDTQSDRNFRLLLESFGVPASREAAEVARERNDAIRARLAALPDATLERLIAQLDADDSGAPGGSPA